MSATVPSTTRAAPRASQNAIGAFRADAAAQLHVERGRAQDRLDRGAVARLAGERAVEIDDVEPARARSSEALRLGRRIVVEHGRGAHLAAHQAHAAPVLQVDRGIEDHGRQPRKLAMRRRPAPWLFSGWNCTPATLPRATAAATAPP